MNNKMISKVTSGILLCTMVAYTTPIFAYSKEETVYSKLNINGESYETLVSNHLINDSSEDLINDLSDLLNIKNTNGSEKFTQDGNSLVWNSNGKDIYYQGESSKELPIECKVHYELDGNEISAQDLVGKTGNVKITIEYINKDEHIVNINGKNEKMYTPFVAICGTIVNNEKNRNINVSHGKVIDDGSKTMVGGIALPGLKESLGISNDTLDIPNTIEITMDSTDFEFGSIFTFVTPKVFEDSDLKIFDELDQIYSKVNTLQTSGKQLEDGAKTLKNGTDTYLEKSKEFNNAMKQVSSGMNEANNNYSKIDSGINSLNKNSKVLVEGSQKISEGSSAIATNLRTISEGLASLQDGTTKLKAGESKVSSGISGLKAGLTTPIPDPNATTKPSTKTTADASSSGTIPDSTNPDTSTTPTKTTTLIQLNKDTISMLKTAYQLSDDPSKDTPAQAPIRSVVNLLEADTKALSTTVGTLSQLESGMSEIKSGTQDLLDGETALKEGADTLASKSEELVEGSKTLYDGTLAIASGTKALNSGSSEMKKGLNTLSSGANSLTDANNQLTEGASTLSSGATTLANGMSKFNKEGVGAICNYINGDLKDISVRLEKLQELANDYNNFTGLNEGASGNVKFIMIIDSIKDSYEDKENAIVNDKKED